MAKNGDRGWATPPRDCVTRLLRKTVAVRGAHSSKTATSGAADVVMTDENSKASSGPAPSTLPDPFSRKV
jgi:hypothetical protein